MSLIPAFQIGVWNAWIFMLCSLIPLFLALLASKGREKGSNFTAIQEYPDRNTIYNQITPANSDLILVSLVKYIKQLTTPEYVDVDKNIASDIAFS